MMRIGPQPLYRRHHRTGIAATCVVLGAFLAFAGAIHAELPEAVDASAPAVKIAKPAAQIVDAKELAKKVTIYRDSFGVPHIDGETDAAVVFGLAYAQAEDYFWQVEDNFILGTGRYAEAHGAKALNSDLLNRAFEIVPESKKGFERLSPEIKEICAAFTAGLNHYLNTHPEVKPRVIKRFEPWHLVALGRHLMLELGFRYTRLHDNYTPLMNPRIAAATGSNAWAIDGSRTRNGHAMLFVNPHQPWFGFGQLYEAHLRSGSGWNFSGAGFFGSPLPNMGHNDYLGWTHTTNEPDIADVWRETFDHPTDPLKYRYDGGYRTAEEWWTTINIRTGDRVEAKRYKLRKTHHGPIVAKEDGKHQLSARVGRLHDMMVLEQLLPMVRATNFDEFYKSLAGMEYTLMNLVYADREGNIFYLYNGQVPRRNPEFDWSKPVDGSDPRTEWKGFHRLEEMPQVLNPKSGYVQNCNSSPFTTTTPGGGNPQRDDYPPYMVEDKDDDKRRAKRARELVGEMRDITFEQFRDAAFDTKLYWAAHELPKYKKALAKIEKEDPLLAKRVRPLLTHMTDGWDYRITAESTQATLCQAWYEELYGTNYPGEVMREKYTGDVAKQLAGLTAVAKRLHTIHGSWQVPWGKVFRAQRVANTADLLDIRFDDKAPSISSFGGHGPMGIVLTQYYTPSIHIPFVYSQKKRYGIVGTTYMAVYAFGDKVRSESLTQFGASGDPKSPHYFDQAKLLSEGRFKKERHYWDDVLADAKYAYRPGQIPRPLSDIATRPKDVQKQ